MDALEVLMNIDKVVPFFQPIISATKQTVIGYEVLGRIQLEDQANSLGDFFHNDSIPDEYLLEVDEHIQQLAFDYYCKAHLSCDLYLNCNANLFINDQGYVERFLARVKSYEGDGLSLRKLVLEIREHDYVGELSQLCHLIMYLKSSGVRVAIDDIGKGGSNLDRIAQLEPDIVKVDLNFIKGVIISQSQQDVLYSYSMFSRKIGAMLLFKGIDNLIKLNAAWRNGGRHYQGYYLGEPLANFIGEDCCKEMLTREFQRFITHERRKLTDQYIFTDELNSRLGQLIKKEKKLTFNELIKNVATHLHDFSFRLYICNQDGVQKSFNYTKINDSWMEQEEFVGKNWSWRPYFLETIVRMQHEKRGILSDLYRDIETNEFIRTFSYPTGDDLYLFIDLPYAFLFEKNGLLF